MVPKSLHPKAFCLISGSCVCSFWSRLPLLGTHTQGGERMKPNCSETTAFSGRIFRKSFSPPFLPERMMAPQGGGALPALKDDSGRAADAPHFPLQAWAPGPRLLCLPSGLWAVAGQFVLILVDRESCLCPTSHSEATQLSSPDKYMAAFSHQNGSWQLGESRSQCGEASDI